MPTIKRTIMTLTFSTLALAACEPEGEDADPLIGAWESLDAVGGDRNQLYVDADMRGDATLRFYFEDELYSADFDVEAINRGGGRYEFEMECDGCADFDFEMECDLVRGGDELECSGDGLWTDYVFEWERD